MPASLCLGIECGGTKTVAILTDCAGQELLKSVSGPANLRLLNDPQLVTHFQKIQVTQGKLGSPASIAIGMAGARTAADRRRIQTAATQVWPDAACYVTNDLETALKAAQLADGKKLAQVLILSGTGSCCFGLTPQGKTVKVGGWGHLLGDKGSGYEIGLRSMKAVIFYYDRDGVWPALGSRILRSTKLNEPDELISWAQNASKADIASLAIDVFDAWAKKDKIATDILIAAAESLATDGADCARRLVKKGTPVQFVLAGSVLLKQPNFVKSIQQSLVKKWPKAIVTPLARESVWGAVELAKQRLKGSTKKTVTTEAKAPAKTEVVWKALPPTEMRNPNSNNLDQLSLPEMIALMLKEESKVPVAIEAEHEKIQRAVEVITTAFKKGGRLFYVGAGTSGRLGVLDASECPPTFRTEPEMVQGIIAGGQLALWKAVEGAEDSPEAGAASIRFHNITKKDVVVGIAASGRTPFVWGAIKEAKKRKAATALICFNPYLTPKPEDRPDILIAPNVGPEVLTGSTRLKSGTATKLILNMLTTLAMVRIGKVVSNLMIDMNPSNVKLRDRAIRIVQEISGVEAAQAEAALEKSKWVIKDALKLAGKKKPAPAGIALPEPT